MTDTSKLNREFVKNLSEKQWRLIADALFESQERETERLRTINAGDREWNRVQDTYSLYLDIHTFVLS